MDDFEIYAMAGGGAVLLVLMVVLCRCRVTCGCQSQGRGAEPAAPKKERAASQTSRRSECGESVKSGRTDRTARTAREPRKELIGLFPGPPPGMIPLNTLSGMMPSLSGMMPPQPYGMIPMPVNPYLPYSMPAHAPTYGMFPHPMSPQARPPPPPYHHPHMSPPPFPHPHMSPPPFPHPMYTTHPHMEQGPHHPALPLMRMPLRGHHTTRARSLRPAARHPLTHRTMRPSVPRMRMIPSIYPRLPAAESPATATSEEHVIPAVSVVPQAPQVTPVSVVPQVSVVTTQSTSA